MTIRKNSDRYPGVDPKMPEAFQVSGVTLEQAIEIADRIGNRNAGCDYSFYVEEDDGNE